MENNNLEQWIAEWLELSPDDPERVHLKEKILSTGFSSGELDEYEKIVKQLDAIPVPGCSPAMTQKFYAEVIPESGDRKTAESIRSFIKNLLPSVLIPRPLPAVTLGILLFIAGFGIGSWWSGDAADLRNMSAELRQMKAMMTFSMLNQSAPTERIRAIHYVNGMSEWDDQIMRIMVNILVEDGNVNVRLIALDALLNKTEHQQVRDGLIYALNRQDTPLVQISIANALISMGESKAVPVFKDLLMNESLNYHVRNRLEKGLKILI
jgi:hypothetical protein